MRGADDSEIEDRLGAFCRESHVSLPARRRGALDGLTFAAKDVFHVQGRITGFGNPDWLRTHDPAERTAAVVARLLDAGAHLAGKTITDELAYSLTGENAHYGTPVNPAGPDRVPGGSSSGSAAAVAGGLVDFAIGTDCGGSVRVPASYCGILGLRPTHGRISLAGAIPFAPRFDTVGWFARDAEILERVGRALLFDGAPPARARRVLLASDAFELADPRAREAIWRAAGAIARRVGHSEEVRVSQEGLDSWRRAFQVVQAAQIWDNHGQWIRETAPAFGPGIRERFEWASSLSREAVEESLQEIGRARARLDKLLGEDAWLCLPTVPRGAPLRATPLDLKEVEYRNQAMCLLSIAGIGGLPQVSLPLAQVDGLPVGLSLVGARGTDISLLAFAREALGPG